MTVTQLLSQNLKWRRFVKGAGHLIALVRQCQAINSSDKIRNHCMYLSPSVEGRVATAMHLTQRQYL